MGDEAGAPISYNTVAPDTIRKESCLPWVLETGRRRNQATKKEKKLKKKEKEGRRKRERKREGGKEREKLLPSIAKYILLLRIY